MTLDLLIYFILLSFLAEILGTIGGFGSSMLFVPIAGLFLDFHSVLGITALFHVSSNIAKITLFRNGFDKKLILSIGIPAILFVLAGSYLTRLIDNNLLEMILAVFLIAIALFFLLSENIVLKPTLSNAIAGGSLSGFAAGLLGTGGAIRGLTMAAFGLEKEVFIATSAIIDLGIDASRSVVYFTNGYVHSHDLYLVPILLGVSVAGTYTGKRVLKYISEKKFRTIALLLILAIGIYTAIEQLIA